MNYFLRHDDEPGEKLSVEDICQCIAEGQLHPTDLVCREGSTDWLELRSLEEFHEVLKASRPLSNPLAIMSLVFGLVSVWLFFQIGSYQATLLWFTTLSAIICGYGAAFKIRRTAIGRKGKWMAGVGCGLGYVFVFLAVVLWPVMLKIQNLGAMTQGIGNCRQIVMAMKLYAGDHAGKYPDASLQAALSSNEVFRQLFLNGQISDERLFGCPMSQFIPDGDIGQVPDYREALKAGENHWALTQGLNDSSDTTIPFIYENPSTATWPPNWDASLNTAPPYFWHWNTGSGRTWFGSRIIVGFHDGSTEVLSLDPPVNSNATLKAKTDGSPIFPMGDPKLKVLNVAK